MKLDLSFEQNQLNISVPFMESAGKFNANFGETSVIHDGQNGATFIPSVSTEGVISWTNDRELPNPEPVNIKGAKGDKGDKGEQGIQGVKGDKGDKGDRGNDGTTFVPDETLTLRNGILSVNTAKEPDPNNTLPITSAAVASTVGNIEILLKTI